ncbi:DUF4276 family protein [Stenotrophomonas maltophilia]|uniref:DUF4276 family protein n=1 Tax=Stenotrophomonas maltophilia TaxID=40324 RepID=UPI000AC46EC0|nr:DUF4276 family protein [Stenotrophomonas maltophilia]
MKVLLEGLVPRIFPGMIEGEHFQCVAHEGKSDLDRSIPRKLKGWRIPDDRFVVLRDNDGGDCLALKKRLADLCMQSGREDTLIRLVCQELEAWFIGDRRALINAFPELARKKKWDRRFDEPDAMLKPSQALASMLADFQKRACAREMAKHLQKSTNLSPSFNVLVAGLERVAFEMGYVQP